MFKIVYSNDSEQFEARTIVASLHSLTDGHRLFASSIFAQVS